MRIVFILWVLVFVLSACNNYKRLQIVKIPLYENCTEKISNYAEEMKERFNGTNQKLDITFSYFDFKSRAHQDIVGFVQIEGQGVNNFDLDVNKIKGMCFPETVVTVDKNELGLRIVNSQILENKSMGIKTYFEITEDKYILYYNGR